jgi:hypothetical protein
MKLVLKFKIYFLEEMIAYRNLECLHSLGANTAPNWMKEKVRRFEGCDTVR